MYFKIASISADIYFLPERISIKVTFIGSKSFDKYSCQSIMYISDL